MHELSAESVYALEFSPGETYLLSAKTEKGENSIVSYEWEDGKIVSLFKIKSPGQICNILWSKNLSASPYLFVKDTAFKFDVEAAMWPLVGCDRKSAEKSKDEQK